MKSKEYWLELFEKENFIDVNDWKQTIPALMIVGALQFGTTEEAKQKIMKWMGLEYKRGMKQKVLYFFRCWKRMEENGVFKNGKVYANLEGDTAGIEFALLVAVAQGYLKRKRMKGEIMTQKQVWKKGEKIVVLITIILAIILTLHESLLSRIPAIFLWLLTTCHLLERFVW